MRLDATDSSDVKSLKKKIGEEWKIDASTIQLSKSMQDKTPLKDNDEVGKLGLKNGDMLFAFGFKKERDEEKAVEHHGLPDVEEDEVDQLLDKEDGWVAQKMTKFCQHQPNGSCLHCIPVAPWAIQEIEPWKTEKLKHIPFTSWLRQRDQGRGECRHTKSPGISCQNCRPLTEEFYTAKKCDRHEPWPKGVCSYCKPDAIRVQRQDYRHVDHVVFENTQVIGSLIEAWRETGTQRGGFLFGRYEPHKDIPLGIRAVVEAVYEPPQVNSKVGLQLKDATEEEEQVKAYAKKLGLVMVGFAWTAIEVQEGKIIKSRDLDKTYLASGPELLQAAIFQNENPSTCRHSMTGKYGSKWISVVITGTEDAQIAPIVFQVSDQMAGMVRDGIITNSSDPRFLQTVDNPAVYVPKVLYDDTNEYNRAVVKEADPTFPPIPFWVDVNFASPMHPQPLLPTTTFPAENRAWAPQSEAAMVKQIHLAKPLTEVFADFHFYLHLCKILDKESIDMICEGVLKKDVGILKNVLARIKPLLPETQSSSKPKSSAPPSTSTSKKHPKEDEWIAQLSSMGFSVNDIKQALEKSKWQGVEQALPYLL